MVSEIEDGEKVELGDHFDTPVPASRLDVLSKGIAVAHGRRARDGDSRRTAEASQAIAVSRMKTSDPISWNHSRTSRAIVMACSPLARKAIASLEEGPRPGPVVAHHRVRGLKIDDKRSDKAPKKLRWGKCR